MSAFQVIDDLRRDALQALRGFIEPLAFGAVAVLFLAIAAAAAWLPARSAAAVDPLSTIRHE